MTPSLLQRIDDYLHQAPRVICEVVPVPPFVLYANRDTDSAFHSYARPAEPLAEPDRALAGMLEEFARRGQAPRWEWIDELYPELAPALERVGIRAELTPLMVVRPESFRAAVPAGFEVRAPSEDEYPRLVRAQRRSFGMADEAPSEAEINIVRSWVARGGRFYAAFAEGEVLGGGAFLPVAGVAEVAGVGTLPEHRRRGVAAAVTSALVRDAFAAGCDLVFLTAGDDAAVQLYRKVGFEVAARGMAAAG